MKIMMVMMMLILTGCNHSEEDDVSEIDKNKLAILHEYEGQLKESLQFEEEKVYEQEEHVQYVYTDKEKKIEFDITLDSKLYFCTDIDLWVYGYRDYQSTFNRKKENGSDSQNVTAFYKTYYPAFEKMDFHKVFEGNSYERRNGSGDQDYQNGYVGYMRKDGRYNNEYGNS